MPQAKSTLHKPAGALPCQITVTVEKHLRYTSHLKTNTGTLTTNHCWLQFIATEQQGGPASYSHAIHMWGLLQGAEPHAARLPAPARRPPLCGCPTLPPQRSKQGGGTAPRQQQCLRGCQGCHISSHAPAAAAAAAAACAACGLWCSLFGSF